MNRFDNLFKKYAGSPIRPPIPEEEIDLVIPTLGKVPVIEDLPEEELEQWDDFVALKEREKKRMRDYLGEEQKLSKEEKTKPPPGRKRANLSPDTLLKMCSKYHDLCCKF